MVRHFQIIFVTIQLLAATHGNLLKISDVCESLGKDIGVPLPECSCTIFSNTCNLFESTSSGYNDSTKQNATESSTIGSETSTVYVTLVPLFTFGAVKASTPSPNQQFQIPSKILSLHIHPSRGGLVLPSNYPSPSSVSSVSQPQYLRPFTKGLPSIFPSLLTLLSFSTANHPPSHQPFIGGLVPPPIYPSTLTLSSLSTANHPPPHPPFIGGLVPPPIYPSTLMLSSLSTANHPPPHLPSRKGLVPPPIYPSISKLSSFSTADQRPPLTQIPFVIEIRSVHKFSVGKSLVGGRTALRSNIDKQATAVTTIKTAGQSKTVVSSKYSMHHLSPSSSVIDSMSSSTVQQNIKSNAHQFKESVFLMNSLVAFVVFLLKLDIFLACIYH